ncbi:hypothetical protein NPIL_91121 [Nephila pilipes]|uniref:Uncharacterized protein n=1 Tax=Nephila pilipes TaxID=299642 RepID=A0A8X6MSP9_NEPPI|nr:hypothetical protein NPIL_91121 [Nephila pilipes]
MTRRHLNWNAKFIHQSVRELLIHHYAAKVCQRYGSLPLLVRNVHGSFKRQQHSSSFAVRAGGAVLCGGGRRRYGRRSPMLYAATAMA